MNDRQYWEEQRERRLRVDGEKCQKCGHTGSDHAPLCVHHIKPRKEFEDQRLAHKLDNLLTLCNNCHLRVEKYSEEVQRESYDVGSLTPSGELSLDAYNTPSDKQKITDGGFDD